MAKILKPAKKRMVVYIEPAIYEILTNEASKSNSSISKYAENVILHSINIKSNRGPKIESEINIEASVYRILSDLPNEILDNLTQQISNSLNHKKIIYFKKNSPLQQDDEDKLNSSLSSKSFVNLFPKKNISKIQKPNTKKINDESNESDSKIIDQYISQTQKVAINLEKFLKENQITQREFKAKYKIDITPIKSWIMGTRSISDKMALKLTKIIGE